MSPSSDARVMAFAAWHSLFWLVVANAVGVLLATLLLVPGLNAFLGEWSYGRWMPVHINLQLFGWLSLPLVGFLFKVYGADRKPAAQWCLSSLWIWSAALCAGALSWLNGHSSDKLFLDWTGYTLHPEKPSQNANAKTIGTLGLHHCERERDFWRLTRGDSSPRGDRLCLLPDLRPVRTPQTSGDARHRRLASQSRHGRHGRWRHSSQPAHAAHNAPSITGAAPEGRARRLWLGRVANVASAGRCRKHGGVLSHR